MAKTNNITAAPETRARSDRAMLGALEFAAGDVIETAVMLAAIDNCETIEMSSEEIGRARGKLIFDNLDAARRLYDLFK